MLIGIKMTGAHTKAFINISLVDVAATYSACPNLIFAIIMAVNIIGRAPVGSAKHGLLIHKNGLAARCA